MALTAGAQRLRKDALRSGETLRRRERPQARSDHEHRRLDPLHLHQLFSTLNVACPALRPFAAHLPQRQSLRGHRVPRCSACPRWQAAQRVPHPCAPAATQGAVTTDSQPTLEADPQAVGRSSEDRRAILCRTARETRVAPRGT